MKCVVWPVQLLKQSKPQFYSLPMTHDKSQKKLKKAKYELKLIVTAIEAGKSSL